MTLRPRARRGITLLEMLLVVVIISLVAGLSYPAVSSGIDSIRLRSASDSVASFLSQASVRAARREEPVEIVFSRADRTLVIRTLRPGFERELALPDGVRFEQILPQTLEEAEADRSFILLPGASFPRLEVTLVNSRGGRKRVRLDPVTGTPSVGAAAEAGNAEAR